MSIIVRQRSRHSGAALLAGLPFRQSEAHPASFQNQMSALTEMLMQSFASVEKQYDVLLYADERKHVHIL